MDLDDQDEVAKYDKKLGKSIQEMTAKLQSIQAPNMKVSSNVSFWVVLMILFGDKFTFFPQDWPWPTWKPEVCKWDYFEEISCAILEAKKKKKKMASVL